MLEGNKFGSVEFLRIKIYLVRLIIIGGDREMILVMVRWELLFEKVKVMIWV